ncbi:MAG: peptide-methionine (S)-S-oxide reductase MsrA [Candidatus Eremiobacteraeota bacterium]|nr:peptide-methionine (S)-S-oxide reductase MsrA [Candidatus Eremiobacteraeota bacterium]
MSQTQTATFAAGCFWGVEAAFRQVPGVLDAVSGYIGGTREAPTYEQVCSGKTGHAEAVQVFFDPDVVNYEKLLSVFWQIHDPTTRNRQGPDVGSQYRSGIFYYTPEQETAASASLAEAQKSTSRPVVTEITAAPEFYRAEEYHQRYTQRHGGAACHIAI